jgi:hypothetical protein
MDDLQRKASLLAGFGFFGGLIAAALAAISAVRHNWAFLGFNSVLVMIWTGLCVINLRRLGKLSK